MTNLLIPNQEANSAAGRSDAQNCAGLMPAHTYVVCAGPEPSELKLLQGCGTELHFLPTAHHLLKIRRAPACVLLDLDHRPACVAAVEQMLTTSCLQMPVIVASVSPTIADAVKWMRAGAADFIEKPYCRATLIDALTGAWSCSKHRRAEPNSLSRRLTIRHQEVLHFIARGFRNHQIAKEMGLSLRTVEMHRAGLLKALGVRTTAEALMLLHAENA